MEQSSVPCEITGDPLDTPIARSPVDPVLAALSPRLTQVLDLLLLGDAEKQVARKLGLSPYTINGYVKDLYRRFGVNSRGELMARFVGER
jgi:DNA-binding NarL/FixJ family response regulator